jgi:hypothetical protein
MAEGEGAWGEGEMGRLDRKVEWGGGGSRASLAFLFNSEILIPFLLFFFLYCIQIQTCHNFKFKYSKHMQQTQSKV